MTVRVVGLFRELVRGSTANLPGASELVGKLSEEVAGQVLRYLGEGVPIIDVMEANLDPIDGRTRLSGGPSIETNGRWVWRNDLRYFVEKYRLGLPAEFLADVASGAPKLSVAERAQLVERWQEFREAYSHATSGR